MGAPRGAREAYAGVRLPSRRGSGPSSLVTDNWSMNGREAKAAPHCSRGAADPGGKGPGGALSRHGTVDRPVAGRPRPCRRGGETICRRRSQAMVSFEENLRRLRAEYGEAGGGAMRDPEFRKVAERLFD